MELHQLRYFVAVADLRNFTRAAERCLVAQPSLSQQIIKLERELGTPLLTRAGRTVDLTDAGRTFLPRAQRILREVEEASLAVSDDLDTGRGSISVGVIPTIAPYFLPRVVRDFVRGWPNAEITVREDVTERTVRELVEGRLDLAVLATPVTHSRLRSEELFEEELLLALPAGHALTSRRRIRMEDLRDEPFLLLGEEHCLGDQVLGFCEQHAMSPVPVCQSAQLLTVQELIALGIGISLVPAMARKHDKSRRRVYRSLVGDRPTRTLRVAWLEGRYRSRVVNGMLDCLRASNG